METEDRVSVPSQLIAVPRPAGPRVQRAALLRRLESAAEPLVLLVAPSGFGKTSLLAEWATTTGAQVAWLSCDESCGEPARFWSRLTASLAARWPAMGSDAALILERPSWDDPELVDSLARDLADLPARRRGRHRRRPVRGGVATHAGTCCPASAGRCPSAGGQPAQPGVLHVPAPAGRGHHRAARRRSGVHPGRGRAAARAGGPGTRAHRSAGGFAP